MITIIKTEANFPAGHFVHTADMVSSCRRAHGHGFRVEVEIKGRTREDGMVEDFSHIKEIIRQFDHKMLVPVGLITESDSVQVYFSHNGKNYMMPTEDVCVLNIESTTAENLAKYIAEDIGYDGRETGRFESVTVRVYESEKSYAEVTI